MIFYKRKWELCLGVSVFIFCLLIAFECLWTTDENEERIHSTEVLFSRESGFYEGEFELQLTAENGTIYYTLDGTEPDKSSIKYETPILIRDATNQDNIHSMRTDVSAGFDKEEVERISSGYLGFQVPEYKIDKATIVRAVAYDKAGHRSDVKTATYFVDFMDKDGYKGMKTLSIVTDPSNLFDYETGIYVTGKTYDEYVKEYRYGDEYYWREEFWALWSANYRNRGIKWERKATCQFYDEEGKEILEQDCGIRIHGGVSRGYNPKSLNLYARKEYDGNKVFQADLFGTGYQASTVTLFQGGNDIQTKAKDYLVCSEIKDFNVSTMSYEPYVLFLNGEYWGVYWLNEKYDAQYFAHYYGVDKDNVIMIKNGELEEGEEDNIKYYSNMVQFCSESDVTINENYDKVCELIDIDSYIDYYAVMLYVSRSGDWPWLNFGLWRVEKSEAGPYGDGKWRWLIFDLNSPGFYADMDSVQYVMEHDAMFRNLMTNDSFRVKLISRIEEIGNSVLDEQTMNERIDVYQKFMSEPMRENNRRFFNDASLTSFNDGMDYLRNFFAERKNYLLPMLDNDR